MPTVVLIRHGETTANARGVLAGRLPGVHLNRRGEEQARVAGERLRGSEVHAIVSSPLERTKQTASHVRAASETDHKVVLERRLTECDYGDWSGRKIATLAKQPLWQQIQRQPSGVTFPHGESMASMAARAVSAMRDWNQRIADEYGDDGLWVAVSHGDVIKAIVADALGVHLDGFQRIHVSPGSLSVIRYSLHGTSVLAVNSHADVVPNLQRRASGPTLGGGR